MFNCEKLDEANNHKNKVTDQKTLYKVKISVIFLKRPDSSCSECTGIFEFF
jgi:hypothetical protein